MIPKYTDEEVMMFAEAYGYPIDLDRIKEFAFSSGILKNVLEIPFEDLPLHLEARQIEGLEGPSSREWYAACVSIRLKIGR